jgi:hypothetical protein
MELTQFEEDTKYNKIANHLRRTGNFLSVLATGCHLNK